MTNRISTEVSAGRIVDIAKAVALLEKGQHPADCWPSSQALYLAQRILAGQMTVDEALAEMDTMTRTG